jgi:hypothetical protein
VKVHIDPMMVHRGCLSYCLEPHYHGRQHAAAAVVVAAAWGASGCSQHWAHDLFGFPMVLLWVSVS